MQCRELRDERLEHRSEGWNVGRADGPLAEGVSRDPKDWRGATQDGVLAGRLRDSLMAWTRSIRGIGTGLERRRGRF
mgnify:CR=1 FL=1